MLSQGISTVCLFVLSGFWAGRAGNKQTVELGTAHTNTKQSSIYPGITLFQTEHQHAQALFSTLKVILIPTFQFLIFFLNINFSVMYASELSNDVGITH